MRTPHMVGCSVAKPRATSRPTKGKYDMTEETGYNLKQFSASCSSNRYLWSYLFLIWPNMLKYLCV